MKTAFIFDDPFQGKLTIKKKKILHGLFKKPLARIAATSTNKCTLLFLELNKLYINEESIKEDKIKLSKDL